MRHVQLLPLAAALLLAPAAVRAKAWQGINPGTSTRSDVTTRFGEPSTQGKLEGRTALVYRDDRAPDGTRQAQFFARDDGVIAEIVVFPASQLDREAVEGTYGKANQKVFTDEFRPVWLYRANGVAVFFGKDGFVEAIRFQPPQSVDKGSRPSAREATPPSRGAAPDPQQR